MSRLVDWTPCILRYCASTTWYLIVVLGIVDQSTSLSSRELGNTFHLLSIAADGRLSADLLKHAATPPYVAALSFFHIRRPLRSLHGVDARLHRRELRRLALGLCAPLLGVSVSRRLRFRVGESLE